MDVPPGSPSAPPEKRVRKRTVIPAILIGGIAVLLVWPAVRGNWTDPAPRNPGSANDGVVSQLIRTSDGHKEIRCAAIVEAPAERVWGTVTDYDHFAEVFPNIAESKGAREADGRWHVTGAITSPVGRWPMDVRVRHNESTNKSVASWDEPHSPLKINRGNWTVTRQSENKTLLEYNLELKVSPFPDFVVRAVLLEQLKPAMRAVAKRAQQKAQE
jgi:uncharacterized protein YndB with AHSA1/START domain